jgi:hypothetical protein
MTMPGAGEGPCPALQIGEYAIPSFVMKTFKLAAEISFVIHDVLQSIHGTGTALPVAGRSKKSQ